MWLVTGGGFLESARAIGALEGAKREYSLKYSPSGVQR